MVSSDALRGVVGSGPHDLDASGDAFAILEQLVAARLERWDLVVRVSPELGRVPDDAPETGVGHTTLTSGTAELPGLRIVLQVCE